MTNKPKRKNSDQQKMMMIGGAIVAAIIVAILFIVVSSQSSFSSVSVDYSQIHQERLDDGGFILGDPNAPITIVAFEDFLCPHCQRYKPTTERLISEYVSKGLARFEYRFLPAVDPTYSALSARYAECADILEPGSFWEAHDLMFELASSARFSNGTPRTFAERIDISYTELLECTSEADQVDKDSQLAQQLGASGTPYIMVRYGNSIPQVSQFGQQPSFEQLSVLIETAQ